MTYKKQRKLLICKYNENFDKILQCKKKSPLHHRLLRREARLIKKEHELMYLLGLNPDWEPCANTGCLNKRNQPCTYNLLRECPFLNPDRIKIERRNDESR
uniref:Uncharacterized protein n=1 Tax=viral metagenome TaxID=1070528 RepID=A0A6M3L7E0_9ZZZZ